VLVVFADRGQERAVGLVGPEALHVETDALGDGVDAGALAVDPEVAVAGPEPGLVELLEELVPLLAGGQGARKPSPPRLAAIVSSSCSQYFQSGPPVLLTWSSGK
jgi:hypothetical protein